MLTVLAAAADGAAAAGSDRLDAVAAAAAEAAAHRAARARRTSCRSWPAPGSSTPVGSGLVVVLDALAAAGHRRVVRPDGRRRRPRRGGTPRPAGRRTCPRAADCGLRGHVPARRLPTTRGPTRCAPRSTGSATRSAVVGDGAPAAPGPGPCTCTARTSAPRSRPGWRRAGRTACGSSRWSTAGRRLPPRPRRARRGLRAGGGGAGPRGRRGRAGARLPAAGASRPTSTRPAGRRAGRHRRAPCRARWPATRALALAAERAAAAARRAGQEVVVVPTASVVAGSGGAGGARPRPARGRRRRRDDRGGGGHPRRECSQVADAAALTWAGPCAPGDVLGLVDGEVVLIAPDLPVGALWLASRMLTAGASWSPCCSATASTTRSRDGLVAELRRSHPEVDVVVHRGARPGTRWSWGWNDRS